jgi:SAM-dependent methyltransferase
VKSAEVQRTNEFTKCENESRVDTLATKTISDFGEQWTIHQENPAYYGSLELLRDLFVPLLPLDAVRDQRVADIGSGTGRIVNMLLDAGAAHVVAVEPSAAYAVLQANTRDRAAQVTYLNEGGDALPAGQDLDLVVSIGTLHHIPQPDPVVRAAFEALRPGGQIFVWLYGKEGNELYLALANPVRNITKRLPHMLLAALCSVLNTALDLYIFACRFLALPLRSYMRNVLARFPRAIRKLTIYDQLNPAYAKYYTRQEAEDLLRRAGFRAVTSWHRHGYSWAVIGQKPV